MWQLGAPAWALRPIVLDSFVVADLQWRGFGLWLCRDDAAAHARGGGKRTVVAHLVSAGLRDQRDEPIDEIARLQTFVSENLKQFEYRLRREIEGDEADQLFLAGSDEVPSGFRDLIEEYFRSLSQEGPGP